MSESATPAERSVAARDAVPGPGDVTPEHPTGRTRTWIVVVLVLVAVAVGAVTAVLALVHDAGIHDGPGVATFTWTPVRQHDSSSAVDTTPQPFTGDIEGHPVSGTAVVVLPPNLDGGADGHLSTTPLPAFRYRGTFAGSPFDLVVSYEFPSADPAHTTSIATVLGPPRITVAGTYGRDAVHATLSVPSPGGPTASRPVTFTGTVGHWRVTGTIPQPAGTSSQRTAAALFVVSG